MAARHAVSTTLAANCTTAQASSSRDRSRPGRSPFTDRDRVGHQTRHAAASGHTADPAPMHVRTCVNVHPRRRSQHRAHSGCAHVPLNPQTLDHFIDPSSKSFASLAAAMSAHHRWLLRSSELPSKSQPRTGRRPAVVTCPPKTLSIYVIEDRCSVLVPSSTTSLMLNQLRSAASLHNRFIDRRICSRLAHSLDGWF